MTIPPAAKAPSRQAPRDIARHVSRDISPTCWYYLNDRSVDLVVEGKTVRLQAAHLKTMLSELTVKRSRRR